MYIEPEDFCKSLEAIGIKSKHVVNVRIDAQPREILSLTVTYLLTTEEFEAMALAIRGPGNV